MKNLYKILVLVCTTSVGFLVSGCEESATAGPTAATVPNDCRHTASLSTQKGCRRADSTMAGRMGEFVTGKRK